MTDLYFGIKLIVGAIIFGFFALIIFIWFIDCSISFYKEYKIAKYLISIGYKRELISTASVGTNHTYGYIRRKKDNWDVIRDYELKGMSLKQVKKKYI